MIEKRSEERLPLISKCLVIHNGSKYNCELENLSISGALVTTTNSLSCVVELGDTCSLLLCGDQAFCPNEYYGKVVRISSPKVGLRFFG